MAESVWVCLGILVEVSAGRRFSHHSSPFSERRDAAPCGTNIVYIKLIRIAFMRNSAGKCGRVRKAAKSLFESGAFNRALPPLRVPSIGERPNKKARRIGAADTSRHVLSADKRAVALLQFLTASPSRYR